MAHQDMQARPAYDAIIKMIKDAQKLHARPVGVLLQIPPDIAVRLIEEHAALGAVDAVAAQLAKHQREPRNG